MAARKACPICKAKTKAGNDCKLKTCKFAPYCHHHTPIKVAPSSIAGRGLIAKQTIPRGTIVADYTFGEPLTLQAFQSRYPSGRATHVWRHPSGTFYDSEDVRRTVSGMANRAPSGKANNSRITGGGKLQTKRTIRAGEEITVAYGSGFRT